MQRKYSRQREAVWNCIKDRRDHPTADMIYQDVRQLVPNISLGTVYRNLLLLKEMGDIQSIDLGDGLTHFDPQTFDHDHFVCTECGKIEDLTGYSSSKFREIAARNFSGKILHSHTCFTGLCAECLATEAAK